MEKELRVTPENIEMLGKNEVFVFGSNESGLHGAGAARYAAEFLGARLGQGFGLAGYTFAIPTKDWDVVTLPLEVVKQYVDRFIVYSNTYSRKWKFLVTKVGCGLAGFSIEEIAPLFKECRDQKNIWLPQEFHDVIDGVYVAPPKSTTKITTFSSLFKSQEDVLNDK